MGARNAMEVAIIISAINNASSVINTAMSDADRYRQKTAASTAQQYANGEVLIQKGRETLQAVGTLTSAYGDQEHALNRLRLSMTDVYGNLDKVRFNEAEHKIEGLSAKYTHKVGEIAQSFDVLKRNGNDVDTILKSLGEDSEKLAVVLEAPAAGTSLFYSRMKNDMHVAAEDMGQLGDMVVQMHEAGVGVTGPDMIEQLTEFNAKAALGASNLGLGGIDDAKKLNALGGMFIKKGLSGATTGENIRRILDNIGNPEHLEKMNAAAADYNMTLDFFDENKKFKGLDNFVAQLGKLEKLGPEAQSYILDPFGGKQGKSLDMVKYLANFNHEYQEYMDNVNRSAKLNTALNVVLDEQVNKTRVAESSWENFKAALGKSVSTPFKGTLDTMTKMLNAMTEFSEKHQTLSEAATGLVAFTGVSLTAVGVGYKLAAMFRYLGGPAAIGFISEGIAQIGTAIEVLTTGLLGVGAAVAGAGAAIAGAWAGVLYYAHKGMEYMNEHEETMWWKSSQSGAGGEHTFTWMDGTGHSMLDAKPERGGDKNQINLNYTAPPITVQQGDPKDIAAIQKMLRDHSRDIPRMILDALNERSRTDYSPGKLSF